MQPEDWGGPLDSVEADEFGYTDLSESANPGELLEPAMTNWEQIVEDDDIDEDPIH